MIQEEWDDELLGLEMTDTNILTTDLWTARNKNGDLFLYNQKPIRSENRWTGNSIILPNSLFPNLSWNDEPLKIKLMSEKMIQQIKQEEYNRGYDFGCEMGLNT